MDTTKKPFCMAPWSHLHVIPNGMYSWCCNTSSTVRIQADTPEEAWNHPKMKEGRVAMMGDTLPTQCHKCAVDPFMSTPAYVHHNLRSQDLIPEAMEKTSDDGTTEFMPVSLDLRTDLCNLKCRMCNPGSSTAIQAEFREAGKTIPVKVVSNVARNPSTLLSDDHMRNLIHVNWAGGEPFMSNVHWETMERLVAVGNTSLYVRYNTNGTFPGKTFHRACSLLSKFRHVEVALSMDGVGEVGEYIRDGMVHDEVVQNMRNLRQSAPNIKLVVDATITSIGLLSLPYLMQLCIDEQWVFSGKRVNFKTGGYLNLCVVAPAFFHETMEKCRAIAASSDWSQREMVTLIDFLISKYTPHQFTELAQLTEMEQIRGKPGFFMDAMAGKLNL